MLKPDQTPKATTLVRTYFKVVFSKSLKTRQTVRADQNAVDSLEAFVNRPVHLGMVTADLLKQWLRHLMESVDGDVSGKTAYQYRRRIINIVQAAFPEVELVQSEPPVPGSLLSYFEAYYRVERMVGTKPASIELMRLTIRKFDRYLGRPATLADLNQRVVGEFFNSMLVVEKLSRATVNPKRGDLFAHRPEVHVRTRRHQQFAAPDIGPCR